MGRSDSELRRMRFEDAWCALSAEGRIADLPCGKGKRTAVLRRAPRTASVLKRQRALEGEAEGAPWQLPIHLQSLSRRGGNGRF